MKLAAEQQQQLLQHLSAEFACAESLFDTLQRENSILKAGTPEQLLEISGIKQRAVIELHQCSLKRDQFISTLQPTGQQIQIDQLMTANPVGESAALWKRLNKLIRQLHDQNEVNGGMVALNQRHNRQALDILSGRSGNHDTYGAKGDFHTAGSGEPLAKA